MKSEQANQLSKDFDKFVKVTKQKEYRHADAEIKKGAMRIKGKLPKTANLETLYSFSGYRYANHGMSRDLKYQISTKKKASGYKFTANLGDDQNLAHLFQNGFDLKQRYGFTHIKPIMKIDFETESANVANGIVAQMNREKGGD